MGASEMKRLSILFIPIIGMLSLVHGEQSPSPPTIDVSGSLRVLPRDIVVPWAVVARFFPEATREMSTGKNSTAVGAPEEHIAWRSVHGPRTRMPGCYFAQVNQHIEPAWQSARDDCVISQPFWVVHC